MKKIFTAAATLLCLALCGCNTVTLPEATYSPTVTAVSTEYLQRGEVTPARIINGTGHASGMRTDFPNDESIFWDCSDRIERRSIITENLRMESKPEDDGFPGKWYTPKEEELAEVNAVASRFFTTLFKVCYKDPADHEANIEAAYGKTLTAELAQLMQTNGDAGRLAALLSKGEAFLDIPCIKNAWAEQAIEFEDGLVQYEFRITLSVQPDNPKGAVPLIYDILPTSGWHLDYSGAKTRNYVPPEFDLKARAALVNTPQGQRISEFYVYDGSRSKEGYNDTMTPVLRVDAEGVYQGIGMDYLPVINGAAPEEYQEYYDEASLSTLSSRTKFLRDFMDLLITDYTAAEPGHFDLVEQAASPELKAVLAQSGILEKLRLFCRENGIKLTRPISNENLCPYIATYDNPKYHVMELEADVLAQAEKDCDPTAYGLPVPGVLKCVRLRTLTRLTDDGFCLAGFDIVSYTGDLAIYDPDNIIDAIRNSDG